MKVTSELDLQSFEFWSGAKDHRFTYSELKELESHLEELYPDGMSETEINDLVWFEEDFICDMIGLHYDEYLERQEPC